MLARKHVFALRFLPPPFAEPTGYPRNFEFCHVTPTSVKIKWDTVSPALRNGPMSGYRIEVSDSSQTVIQTNEVKRRTLRYTVENLKPNTYYGFRIAAVNAAGIGIFSPVLKAKTSSLLLV